MTNKKRARLSRMIARILVLAMLLTLLPVGSVFASNVEDVPTPEPSPIVTEEPGTPGSSNEDSGSSGEGSGSSGEGSGSTGEGSSSETDGSSNEEGTPEPDEEKEPEAETFAITVEGIEGAEKIALTLDGVSVDLSALQKVEKKVVDGEEQPHTLKGMFVDTTKNDNGVATGYTFYKVDEAGITSEAKTVTAAPVTDADITTAAVSFKATDGTAENNELVISKDDVTTKLTEKGVDVTGANYVAYAADAVKPQLNYAAPDATGKVMKFYKVDSAALTVEETDVTVTTEKVALTADDVSINAVWTPGARGYMKGDTFSVVVNVNATNFNALGTTPAISTTSTAVEMRGNTYALTDTIKKNSSIPFEIKIENSDFFDGITISNYSVKITTKQTKPVLTASLTPADGTKVSESRFSGAVVLTLKITDNPIMSANGIATVSGVEYTMNSDGVLAISIDDCSIDESKTYEVEFTYTDIIDQLPEAGEIGYGAFADGKYTCTITIDREAPEVEFIYPDGKVVDGIRIYGEGQTLGVTTGDATLATASWQVNGGAPEDTEIVENKISLPGNDETEYVVMVEATDSVGNTTKKTAETILVDTLKPRISAKENKGFLGNLKSVTFTVDDAKADFSTAKLTVTTETTRRGKTTTKTDTPALKWENGIATVDFSKYTGNVTYTLEVADYAGNKALYSSAGLNDNEAPELDVTILNEVRKTVKEGILFWKNIDGNLKVSVTADDGTGSGIAEINYGFEQDAVTEKAFVLAEGKEAPDKKTVVFEIENNYQGEAFTIYVDAKDVYENTAKWNSTGKYMIDREKGEITFGIDGTPVAAGENHIADINGVEKTLTISVGEEYFDYSISVTDTDIDSNSVTTTYKGTKEPETKNDPLEFEDDSQTEFTLEQNHVYNVTVSATDFSGNELNSEITVCYSAAPEVDVSGMYTEDADHLYYNATGSAEITVKSLCLTNFDIEVENSSSENPDAYTLSKEGFVYTVKLDFDDDADYAYEYTAVDAAGNETTISDEFTVDTTMPVLEIKNHDENSNLTSTYYKNTVMVDVKVTEHNFDRDSFVFYGVDAKGNKIEKAKAEQSEWAPQGDDVYTCTVTLDPNAVYNYEFVVVDKAKNSAAQEISNICVDNTTPELEVLYSEDVGLSAYKTIFFWNPNAGEKNLNVTLKGSDNLSGVDRIIYTVKANDPKHDAEITVENKPCAKWAAKQEYTFTLEAEDSYKLSYEIFDHSGNKANYNSQGATIGNNDVNNDAILVVDGTAPVIGIAIPDGYNGVSIDDGKYHYGKETLDVPVTITETNFYPECVKITVTSEKGANPEKIVTVDEYLGNDSRLTWNHEGNAYTASIPLKNPDTTYNVSVAMTDYSGNVAATAYSETIVLDTTKPVIELLDHPKGGKYSEHDGKYYYDAKSQEVSVTITETNFYPERVKIYVTHEKGTTGVAVPDEEYDGSKLGWTPAGNGVYKASIPLSDPDTTYKVSVAMTDYAGNEAATQDTDTIVLDQKEPVITLVSPDDGNIYTVNKVKSHYYSATTKEFNMVVVKDDNFSDAHREDVTVTDEYGNSFTVGTFTHDEGNVWTAPITLNTANAEYRFSASMVDDLGNSGASEKTDRIVLDTTAPVVSFSGVSSNQYYANPVTGSISVTELNFVDDNGQFNGYITCTSSSRNIDGASTAGAPTPAATANWSHNGTSHSTSVSFGSDAIYTFGNVQVQDMAGNTATSAGTYEFTVDQTAPEQLSITYSTEVAKNIASNILFFDAPVTVTLHATDYTAGVETMTYRCTLKDGVSAVNAGVGDTTVNIDANQSTVTYDFQLPASALNENNQFDGVVSFSVTDRSGNSTSHDGSGEPELVVDNIAPNITIDYDQHKTSEDEETYFYGEKFTVTITVNEANFDKDDIQVLTKSTKNKTFTPVTESFRDVSVDEHVIEIPFTDEDEYTIQVRYADHSTNEMEGDRTEVEQEGEKSVGVYESPLLVLDSKKPEIKFTKDGKDADRHAYNDDVIDVTVTVSDDHITDKTIDADLWIFAANTGDDVEPQDMLDGCGWQKVEGGKLVFTADGKDNKVWKATTGNLDEDAVYKIAITANDQTENENNQTSEEAVFSVNRNGSTFYYEFEGAEGDENFNNYSITNQEKLYTLKMHEISVETIETNANADTAPVVTVTRDTEVNELEQGSDFDVTHDNEGTNSDENWDEYTYTIATSNFENEGAYGVDVVSTTTGGENGTESKNYSAASKTGVARFITDNTEPTAVVGGIMKDDRIQSGEQAITVTLSDNVALDRNQVELVIERGSEVDRIPLTGMEIVEENGVAAITTAYTLKSSVHKQNIHVELTDIAGNLTVTDAIKGVRVSSNIFLLHIEFFIVIGILLLALIGVGTGVAIDRKKKRQKAA